MFAIRNLVRANTQIAKNAVAQRNMSVVPIPSRQKVGTGALVVMGLGLVISWTFIPAWVLCNIKNYRHKE